MFWQWLLREMFFDGNSAILKGLKKLNLYVRNIMHIQQWLYGSLVEFLHCNMTIV